MQSSLIYLFGSGLVFFVGVGLILAGLAASFGRGPVWSRVSPVAIVVGTFAAAGSATPLPIWFYAIAILLSVAWLAVDPLGSRVSPRAKSVCRALVALVWLAGATAELPYHLSPTIPPVGERQLYLFGDSLSAGLTDDLSENWPQLIARDHDLNLASYAQREHKVATALELSENASLAMAWCYWKSAATTCWALPVPPISPAIWSSFSSASPLPAGNWSCSSFRCRRCEMNLATSRPPLAKRYDVAFDSQASSDRCRHHARGDG